MKLAVISAAQYEQVKPYLLEQIKGWEGVVADYEAKYNPDFFNRTDLLKAWHQAFKRINQWLLSSYTIDCFIIKDDADVLQGIAFGAQRPYKDPALSLFKNEKQFSYHIHDILVAPWNVIARAFKKTEETLQYRHKNIGRSLIRLIVTHVLRLPQEFQQIVTSIEVPFDSGALFFRKCFFTQITPTLGLSYELKREHFANIINTPEVCGSETPSITSYSALEIIENYVRPLQG